uniref:Pyrrolo-quinoline quinone repeat domain-containing protein n=1 Tax=Thermomicrobium roseum TaxID=500 RepID=A0A7C2BFH8_THERO
MNSQHGNSADRQIQPGGGGELARARDELLERGLELWQRRRSSDLARLEPHPWKRLRGSVRDPYLERQGLRWQVGIGILYELLAVSDNGWVLLFGGGGLAVLEPESGEAAAYIQFLANSVSLSSDGRLLMVEYKRRLSCWNLESATLLWERQLEDDVWELELSPDGSSVAVTSTTRAPDRSNGRSHLLVLGSTDGRLRWQVELPNPSLALAFSPSGALLAVGTSGGHLLTYGQDGQLVWEAKIDGPVAPLAFSPDSTRLAARVRWSSDADGPEEDLQGLLMFAAADGQLLWRTNRYERLGGPPSLRTVVTLPYILTDMIRRFWARNL